MRLVQCAGSAVSPICRASRADLRLAGPSKPRRRSCRCGRSARRYSGRRAGVLFATRVFGRRGDEIRIRARQLSIGRLSVRLARHSPVRCDGQFGEPRQNGLGETAAEKTNGLDPNYYNTGTPLRRRFRVSPVGIWWRDRYRRYSADRAYRLFVVRTRRIVIFRTCVADKLTDTRFVWLFMSSPLGLSAGGFA